MLREVDPTMVWYKGKKTDPFEKDAINDPEKWPTMSTKMKEYAHNVKTRPAGGMCYFTAQISFDGDQETFKEDAKRAAELINGICFPNMLQYLEVSEMLIIMNSYPRMNAPWWSAEWKRQMNDMARKDEKSVSIDFTLVDKPIYLGKGTTDFSKIKGAEKKRKWMMVQQGLHANFPKDQVAIGKVVPGMGSQVGMHQAALQGQLSCYSQVHGF